MNLKNKKVLVTGGTGFIGSHLVEELVRKGTDVRVLLRYNSRNSWGMLEYISQKTIKVVEVWPGDLRNFDSVRDALRGREVVFHLGASIAVPYSFKNPLEVVQTNIMGTAHLLRACLDRGVDRLVHTSTSEVYGSAQRIPMDEDHPQVACSPYGATKIAADKLVQSFVFSYDLPAVVVRPFNTYGPRQSARAIIPAIIVQALTGNRIKLGNLTPTRDMNYVTDIVNGFIRAAETDSALGEVFNLGTGKEISMRELAQKILKLMKMDEKKIVQSGERQRTDRREVFRLRADNSKAREQLGWLPSIDLDTGLGYTIDWIKKNIAAYKSHIYNV